MMKDLTTFSVTDMQSMAEAIANSGLFGMKTPDQALALMLVAQSEGEHPATVTQDYDIIQGRACRKSHSLLARFQAMGGKVEWHTLDRELAEATFSHPQGGRLKVSWTIEQAKTAGLAGKDNWKKYPQAMLRARCISEGIRAVYPAAIGGMLISEEAQDMPREIDMGSAEVVPASTHDKVAAKLQALEAEPEPEPKFESEPMDPDVADFFGEDVEKPTLHDVMQAIGNVATQADLSAVKAQARAIYLDLDKKGKAALTRALNAAEEGVADVDSDA